MRADVCEPTLGDLPAPPKPTNAAWMERARSVAIVLSSAALGQVIVHGLTRVMGTESASTAWYLLHRLADANVVIALVGLVLMLPADPGVVRRSADACLPVPQAVAARLRANEPLHGLPNQHDEASGMSYCVRCCIWRDATTHHCGRCQVCVRDFDHHCAIFGKCVGGPARLSRKGNRPTFLLNIGNLGCACGTAVAALLLMFYQLVLDSVAIGLFFLMLVLWPVSALSMAYLRNNWSDIVGLLWKRRRRKKRSL